MLPCQFLEYPSPTKSESEIAKSRDNAWAVVNLREHRVLQVFTSHENRLDLVVLGTLNTGFKNGNFLDSPFASHMIIEESSIDSGDPRLRRMQVFAVSHTIFTCSPMLLDTDPHFIDRILLPWLLC